LQEITFILANTCLGYNIVQLANFLFYHQYIRQTTQLIKAQSESTFAG